MIISDLTLKTSQNKVRIQVNVESNKGIQLLWFELDEKYKNFLTHDRYDGFVISLLNLAAAVNEPIYIEGALSASLFFHLLYYIKTLTPFYPGLDNISIYPKELSRHNCNIKQAGGASFILNVDSIITIQTYLSSIEYLLYVNLGEYYPGKAPETTKISRSAGGANGGSFKERVEKLKEANETYLKKELIAIDSNLEMFAYPLLDPELAFGTMTIGAALLLQGALARYYMPTTVYDYDLSKGSIPLPGNFFITDTLELVHDPTQYSRAENQETPLTPGNSPLILNLCGIDEPQEKDCPSCRQCISAMIASPGTSYKEIFFNVFAHSHPQEKSKRDYQPPKPFINIPGVKKIETMVYDNYDVTVIMPFYKKYRHFVKVFPSHARYFPRPGVEVIMVIDEPGEEEKVLNFIRQYPQVNWIIIVNDSHHEWRNPSKALNVGIKHASKKYVLVISPESELATDIMTQFRDNIKDNQNFCIGQVHFMAYGDSRFFIVGPPYGSIMVSRDNLVKIGGYDENIVKWGGDDDNLRFRLQMIGVKETFLPDAHIFHWEEKKVNRHPRLANVNPDPITARTYKPTHWQANNGVFGNDFNRIAYDYRKTAGRHPAVKNT